LAHRCWCPFREMLCLKEMLAHVKNKDHLVMSKKHA